VPVAWKPLLMLPQGSAFGAAGRLIWKVTGLVTPRIVRSPTSSMKPLLPSRTAVDLKVICGNFAVSRKSGLRRCSSRLASRVSTLETSIVALI